MNKIFAFLTAAVLATAGVAWAQQGGSDASQDSANNESAAGQDGGLEALLNKVRQAVEEEKQINQEREQEFLRRRNERQQLLEQARAELRQERQRSDRLKNTFDENEKRLADLETELANKQGNLGEMFGVVKQVAGDTRSEIENSLVSAQIPGRSEFLANLAQRKKTDLPTVTELRKLWFEMQREITEQGKIVQFQAPVLNIDGEREDGRTVTRLGVFTAFSNGQFLRWNAEEGAEEGMLQVLAQQPAGRFQALAANVEQAQTDELVMAAIDPSRGSILDLVVQKTPWKERILEGGGLIGTIILTMGTVGLLLVLWRAVMLFGWYGFGVSRQLRSDEPSSSNPLGRVMQIYHDNPDTDVETLELKLDEAVLKETRPIETGLNFIKILYVVAPLLGLLGTVVGMIETFQQITLFGTGDPKRMASGISLALVTTMLGLSVAIPLTLLHAWLASKSRSLINVLEEQSSGIVAALAEKRHATGS